MEGPTAPVFEYVGPVLDLNFNDDDDPLHQTRLFQTKHTHRNKGCMTDSSLCSTTENHGLNGYGHVEELAVSLVQHLMSADKQASHATSEDICRLNGKLFKKDRQPSLNLHTPKKRPHNWLQKDQIARCRSSTSTFCD